MPVLVTQGQVPLSFRITKRCCLSIEFRGFSEARSHPYAFVIEVSKVSRCVYIMVLYSLPKPLNASSDIFLYALATTIHLVEIVLRHGMTALSSVLVCGERLFPIPSNSTPEVKTYAQMEC